MGDVLRTTSLLNVLDGEITWITKKESMPLLKNNPFLNKVADFNDIDLIKKDKFDLVLSLDDEYECCKLASDINTKNIIGAYLDNCNRRYTDSSSLWFDISLISKFGKEKADKLKSKNNKSYQEMLFKMINKKFNGEEYILGIEPKTINKKIIGLETRADKRWPLKVWNKYDELSNLLKKDGYKIFRFQQRKDVLNYIDDINNCNIIVTGDTLAMHIALALKKKTIALFGPTSANEIYDYGLLKKIVSPINCVCCYKNQCDKKLNCMDLISVKYVYNTIRSFEK